MSHISFLFTSFPHFGNLSTETCAFFFSHSLDAFIHCELRARTLAQHHIQMWKSKNSSLLMVSGFFVYFFHYCFLFDIMLTDREIKHYVYGVGYALAHSQRYWKKAHGRCRRRLRRHHHHCHRHRHCHCRRRRHCHRYRRKNKALCKHHDETKETH